MILLGAVIVAAAVAWTGFRIADAIRASRADATRERALRLLGVFAPGINAAEQDLRAILAWEPLARAARKMAVEEFALLDRAAGATFPFSKDRLQTAHARWTADWLAWERHHDVEYKLKAAAAAERSAQAPTPAGRAQMDAIESEKLELYQRRYEEYIRVARALQGLIAS